MLSVQEMDCQYGKETFLPNILWRESKRKIESVVRVNVKALRASKEQEETVSFVPSGIVIYQIIL